MFSRLNAAGPHDRPDHPRRGHRRLRQARRAAARRADHRRPPRAPVDGSPPLDGVDRLEDGRARSEGGAGVNVLDTLRIAWQGASANKLRSALTVLGVLIGVSAVIILLAVGTGSSQAVQNRINALGTNTITVLSRGRFGRGPSTTGTQSQSANLTAAVGARRSRTRTRRPTSSRSRRSSRRPRPRPIGAASYSTSVIGTTPAYLDAEDYTPRGRQPDHQRGRHQPQARRARRPDGAQQPLRRPGRTRSARRSSSARRASRSSACSPRRAPRASTNEDSVVIAPYTAVQDELTGRVDLVQRAARAGEVDRRAQQRRRRGRGHPRHRGRHDRRRPALQRHQPGHAAVDGRVDLEHLHDAARRGRGDLAARRRDRRDEHHARHGHRAHPRDRDPQGGRRAASRRSSPSSSSRRCCSR